MYLRVSFFSDWCHVKKNPQNNYKKEKNFERHTRCNRTVYIRSKQRKVRNKILKGSFLFLIYDKSPTQLTSAHILCLSD